MLRVFGKRDGGEISIQMRQKKGLFPSRHMLIGFGAALLIHSLAFGLISFPSLQLNRPKQQGPALVTAQLPLSGAGTHAQIHAEHLTLPLPQEILMPRKAHPQLNLRPQGRTVPPTSYLKAASVPHFHATFQAPAPPAIAFKTSPQLHISISGPLAEVAVENDGSHLSPVPLEELVLAEELTLKYHVACENRTGHLCWWSKEDGEPEQDTTYTRIAQEVLNNITFKKIPSSLMTTGQIEIAFTYRSAND